MLQSPLAVFVTGLKMVKWVFVPPPTNPEQVIEQMVRWSHVARKEGLLALEAQAQTITDPFMRKGLQLLVDGVEPDRLRGVLEVEIDAYAEQLKLSPTIGILGAVMGLIHVMENLSDPSKLGAGIAVAFVATIYGVGAANLIFLPIAKKLLFNINRLIAIREMFIDGLIGISNGDNPRIIESRMQGYVV
jgi:chemotaxis protein MotA